MIKSIEKHNVNITIATIVIVVLFIISSTWQLSGWKSDTEKKMMLLDKGMEMHEKYYAKHDASLNSLTNENFDVKVRLTTIETKLTNIESLLIEIRENMK